MIPVVFSAAMNLLEKQPWIWYSASSVQGNSELWKELENLNMQNGYFYQSCFARNDVTESTVFQYNCIVWEVSIRRQQSVNRRDVRRLYGWSYCFGVLWAVFQNNAGGAWIMQEIFEAGVMINGEMTL
jgi:hypothetical protein